jgi:hypothetical protein
LSPVCATGGKGPFIEVHESRAAFSRAESTESPETSVPPLRQSLSVAIPADPEPAATDAARIEFHEINARNEKILRPLVEAHLTSYDAILQDLETAHGRVTNDPRLNLLGPSREAARWLVTGRCIGLARAGLDLVRIGYSSEAIPTIRSLHEANRLLGVFTHRGEDELVTSWIEGRGVSRRAIMQASQRQEEAIRVEMMRAGEKLPALTKSYFDQQYGRWSEFAHQRRRHLVDQVAEAPRMMAVGPHPDWRARAVSVDHFGDVVSELLSVGGAALTQSLGPKVGDQFQRSFVALTELKRKIPLSSLAQRDG